MNLYDVMRTTHAVREFTDEPLPDDTLYRILDNARFAPSRGNRQGTHITVVSDTQTRSRLAELGVPGAADTSPTSWPAKTRGTRYIPAEGAPVHPQRRTARQLVPLCSRRVAPVTLVERRCPRVPHTARV